MPPSNPSRGRLRTLLKLLWIRLLPIELCLAAGLALSLLGSWALSQTSPKLTYAGRWICFDDHWNAYRVRVWSGFGRSRLDAASVYSVAEPIRVPAYLNLPVKQALAVTVIDGWPWPCLARYEDSPASGNVAAKYSHVANVWGREFPIIPIWGALVWDTLVIGGSIGVAWFGTAWIRRRWGHLRGRCLGCGYDLRGLAAAPCPECGRVG